MVGWSRSAITILCLAITPVAVPAQTASVDWPQWRGPHGTGVAAADANPPIQWSESENVRWKSRIPGLGHSTPVVAGDFLFLTTAVAVGESMPPRYSGRPGAHDNLPVTQRHEFRALAVRRSTGALAWQTKIHEALPHEGGHQSASLASASPVTDGEHVIVFFGSHGLAALTPAGEIVWKKQLGEMHSKHGHGEGSSPALHGDTVVVNWDHEGASFILALDKRTGEELWRRQRDEVTSWASPLIVEQDDRVQVIVCGTQRVRGYDLRNGEVFWECGGLSANVVATPVAANGVVYVGSSYEIRSLMAIDLVGAAGDLTGTKHVLWQRRDRTPYVPSPLLLDGHLYFLRHYQGILTRVEARTGDEPTGPFRLGALRNLYASPVAAAGRIYFTDLDGVTQVLSSGDIPRLLAVNRLDEQFSASPVAVGSALYLRGREFLYRLEASAP